MPFGSIIQAVLGLARVALASLLLVGVPMAEAATCGGEGVHAAAALTVAASDAAPAADADGLDHDINTGGDDQHCIHGHCHHSTPFKTNETASPLVVQASAVLQPILTAVALTRVSVGLERPPKA
jgi:hypothetical protein